LYLYYCTKTLVFKAMEKGGCLDEK